MSENKITWHRGSGVEGLASEPGEWHAKVNGECIARAYVREGTPTGYWGRYRTYLYGKAGYVTTLAEFKDQVRRAVEATS